MQYIFSGLCLELHLTSLPGVSSPVLLVARDNCNIEILDRAEAGCWHRRGVMQGHEDWVRCLDSRPQGEEVMVASGGQDTYVRLWRLSRAGAEERMEETEELSEPILPIKAETGESSDRTGIKVRTQLKCS